MFTVVNMFKFTHAVSSEVDMSVVSKFIFKLVPKRVISVALRTALCFGIVGALTACNDEHHHGEAKMDHSEHAEHHKHHHHHEALDIKSFGAETPVPTVKLSVTKDPMAGWNILISTKDFKFTPENVNLDNVTNEGHAHLYIDGQKKSRLYSQWYHLSDLEPGKHELRLTLNANNHSPWSDQGKEISTTVTIEQK